MKEVPTLRLSVAQLQGGTVMTVNFHHLVFDMGCMSVFLRTWAAHCRGEDPPPLPEECLSRDILRRIPSEDYEYHLAALNDRIKLIERLPAKESNDVTAEQAKPAALSEYNFHFSTDALRNLKAEVTAAIKQSTIPATA